MQYYGPFLSWIDHQKDNMIALTKEWSNINSGSKNLEGLERQLKACRQAFSGLGGKMEELQLEPYLHIDEEGKESLAPLGKALHIKKRMDAKVKLLFSGHMDTVYGINSPFQKAEHKNEEILNGPGVADMKGGLVILLYALLAFEKTPFASNIGWEILISPDEEIGSPGSRTILEGSAKQNHLALIFEPSFSDGALVSARGGSQNITFVVHGKTAHAGRDFHEGKSALLVACECISEINELNKSNEKVIVNIGELNSGHGFNIVPSLAIVKINLRAEDLASMEQAREKISEIVKKQSGKAGIRIDEYPGTIRYPKIEDESTLTLFQWLSNCADDLGIKITKRPTKGVSDGNLLASFGLANIDSLGPIGGNIHTPDEYIHVKSLVERAKLTALLLMKIANQEFDFRGQNSVINL